MTTEEKINIEVRIEEMRARIINELNGLKLNNYPRYMARAAGILGLQTEADMLENELNEVEKYETIEGINEVNFEDESFKRMEEQGEFAEDYEYEEDYDLPPM